MTISRLKETERIVNVIRLLLGLGPLYGAQGKKKKSHGRYWHHEALCRRADPSCKRCEGAGYSMGAAHDPELICACVSAEPAPLERSPAR